MSKGKKKWSHLVKYQFKKTGGKHTMKHRRSYGRVSTAHRARRSKSSAGVGGVLMKGAMGAVGYGLAGMVSGYIPGGFSAAIKTALVLGLAYLFGLRHAVVRYGLMLSVAVIVLGYARNLIPQLQTVAA